MKRLPDAELEVMKTIWRLGRPASNVEIRENAAGQSWTKQALHSMLGRLEGKGFVGIAREGKSPLYHALIDRETYLREESKTVLDKLFDGSPKSFMASLVQSNTLKDEDLRELQDFLDEVQKGRD